VDELWPYYFSLAGNLDHIDLDAYLHDLMPLPQLHRELLAQAVDEMRKDIAGRAWFRCRYYPD
jgi:hypothetical protein